MKTRMLVLFMMTLGAVSALFAQRGEDGSHKEKTFTVSKGGTLDAGIDGGDVRIGTWERNEVAVRMEYFDEEDVEDLRMIQSGNTIRITTQGGWGHGGTRLLVTIPAHFSLKVGTTYGDIVVRDKIIGDIELETSAGNLRMSDVQGTVAARTSGGDIRTGTITGSADLKTSGGDIDAGPVSGALDVHTSGGNITLGNVGGRLKLSTSGGDISIGDIGNEAVISTSGGDIVVGTVSGKVELKTSGGDIHLKGGSGPTRAVTNGGDIALEKISGSIEARTSGGEIRADLTPSGNGRSRLVSAGGEIMLVLPGDTKATIEARIRIQGRWKDTRESYDIRSDFPSQRNDRDNTEKEITSTFVINGGGETIVLETVNADIIIRKR